MRIMLESAALRSGGGASQPPRQHHVRYRCRLSTLLLSCGGELVKRKDMVFVLRSNLKNITEAYHFQRVTLPHEHYLEHWFQAYFIKHMIS